MTPTVRIRAALIAIALTLTGAVSGSVGATDSAAAVDYDAYIAKAAVAAKASKKLYGVPRAVTIAQSILESGWGRSGLTTRYRNYYGIKCGSLISPYQKGCVALASYEYVKGKRKKYVSRFRVYSSMEKSFLDHGRLLDRADRYNAAFRYTNNPDQFIREVHRAGYATDPNYSNLVISLMKRWNLYRFDSVPSGVSDPNTALIAGWSSLAQRNQAATGVPGSVTLAQALFHSGSGKGALAIKARNYFSLVCGGTKSTVATGCLSYGGMKYRTYRSLADSMADHGTVLSTNPRYAAAMKLAANPKAFLTAVAKAGWSSSTTYSARVYAVISKYGLTRFDLLIRSTLAPGARGAKVTAVQNLLTRAGSKVAATGYFGTVTRAAVKSYQKRAGLPVTGTADPLTLSRLTPDVGQGATGGAVAALHALLRGRGYTVNAGSSFGSKTLAAVRALQKKTRLPQTGIVSVRTWAVLFG